MIRNTGMVLTLLVFSMQLHAADSRNIYTQPDIPSQEALDRLNMKMVWRAFSPMEGRRDGYHDIQILDNHVVAQTRSGTVVLFHGSTGETLWKTNFGKPYQVVHNLAFNDKFIFAVNENDLYALHRKDGAIAWRASLAISLTAAPSADNVHVYLCGLNRRIYCYALPKFGNDNQFVGYEKTDRLGKLKVQTVAEIAETEFDPGSAGIFLGKGTRTQGQQPLLIWEFPTQINMIYPPLVTEEQVAVVGQKGDLITLDKFSESRMTTRLTHQPYATDGPVISTPEIKEHVAYIGSTDSALHAYDLKLGKLRWRFTVGSTITQRAFVTPNEVFISGERTGLSKVSNDFGDPMWSIPNRGRFSNYQEKSERVISANPKFVYTLDKSGRMVILDRNTGIALTTWDIHDFVFPVTNRTHDRVFLAANNGLIVCLRDRDYPNPVFHFEPKQTPQAGAEVNPKTPVDEMLLKALEMPIMEPAAEEKPLKEVLAAISQKYMIAFELSPKGFGDQKLEEVEAKPVKTPAAENKPLKEWLAEILIQAQIEFMPIDKKILLYQAKMEK